MPSGARRSNDSYCSKKKSVIGASSTAACGGGTPSFARFDHERSGEIAAGGIASHRNSRAVPAERGSVLLHPLQYREAIIEARRKRPLRCETIIGAHDHHRVFRRDPARDVGGVLRWADGEATAVKVEHHRVPAAR